MRTSTAPVNRLADLAIGVGLMAGSANVVMQLAHPSVGYGVVESRVDAGNLFKHPWKRTRTTLTYLAVAILGNEQEKVAYRHGVDQSHAGVRSTESSPVVYHAFDPELQLWVAACIYRGFWDTYRLFGAPLNPAAWERIYRECAVFGTILQVPPHRWPADIVGFEDYWASALEKITIDDTVRTYLTDLIMLEPFPAPIRLLGRRLNRFLTTGFLPERFRAEMRLSWTPNDQHRFDWLMAAIRLVTRIAPGPLLAFPYNALLWDLRWRMRTGRPLV